MANWESLDCKEIQPVHPIGDQSWVFIGRTDVEAEIPILWPPDVKSWLVLKDSDAGERLRAGGEGDDRGWDAWMALPTQWTWIGVDSGSWWRTARPDVLWFMGLQTVRHDWAPELNWMISSSFYMLIWHPYIFGELSHVFFPCSIWIVYFYNI